MPLSEIKVRNLKPKDKSCKISDSDGRYLLIAEKSSKLWRFKYCFDAKEKLLAWVHIRKLAFMMRVRGEMKRVDS